MAVRWSPMRGRPMDRHGWSHRGRRATSSVAVALALIGAAASTGGIATSASAATGCSVAYTITNQWPDGFGANVIVTNYGDAVTSWKVAWTFGAGQTITQLWNGSPSQSGADVTVTNAPYNPTISSGGTVSFGFNGLWRGSNPVPTTFALNGVTCAGPVVSPSPSDSPSVTPSP